MCSNTHAASMLNTTIYSHINYTRIFKIYQAFIAIAFMRVWHISCAFLFCCVMKFSLEVWKYFSRQQNYFKHFVSSVKIFMAPVSFDSFTAIFIYFLTFRRCALNRKMMYASKNSNLDLKECLDDLRKLFIDVWFIVLISLPLWRNWESVRRTRLVEM